MAVIGGGIEIRYKTAKQESAGFRPISIRKIHSFAETELLSCLTILLSRCSIGRCLPLAFIVNTSDHAKLLSKGNQPNAFYVYFHRNQFQF